jgi:hypothetical protein
MLFNIDRVFYSVTTQYQYIVNNRLHVSVVSNHLQARLTH